MLSLIAVAVPARGLGRVGYYANNPSQGRVAPLLHSVKGLCASITLVDPWLTQRMLDSIF